MLQCLVYENEMQHTLTFHKPDRDNFDIFNECYSESH
jgi:hypothetical protein